MNRAFRGGGVALACCIAAFSVALGLRSEVNLWVGTGLAATFSLSVLFFHSRSEMRSWFTRPSFAVLTVGLLVGCAMSLATWSLYPISTELFPFIAAEVETLYGLLRQPPGPIEALPLLLFVVAVEELVWRGLAMDVLMKRMGRTEAVIVASVLYIIPQIAMRSLLLMFVALCCGLVWGALRARFGGLAAPLLAHGIWDLLVFVLFPLT